MKKLATFALIALAASTTATALANGGPSGMTRVETETREVYTETTYSELKTFAALDANDDAYLERAEMGQEFCAMFDIVDADGDDRISPAEYNEHARRISLIADIVKAFMIRWDKNRDGLLTRKEFEGRPGAFVYADLDEDNVLYHRELMRLIGSDQMIQYDPVLYFETHDLDSDGLISQREWQKVEPDLSLFRQIDVSNNRVLLPAEVRSFLYRYERRLAPLDEKRAKKTTIHEEEREERYVRSEEGQG